MLNKDTEFKLDHLVTDPKVGDQISARLISVTPLDSESAKAILAILDTSPTMKSDIENRLVYGFSGNGEAGKEIAKKVNKMVDVLIAKANSNPLDLHKKEMGSDHMSDETFECLVNAFCDRLAALEFKQKYNKMIDVVQAIV